MYLETRIEQLKAQIAEKEAYQKKLANEYSNPYSKYHYGHIFDAIAGNSSGLDKEAADEAAYRNMLLQQEFQAEQNELNRKNTMDIAKMNKANELETKKDEYIRGRNKAAYELNYARQALSQDRNNYDLHKAYNLAKEDFDFYDRKLGGQGYDNIPVRIEQTTKQITEGPNNNQVISIVKSIVDKKEYTNDDRTKLQVLSEYVDDPTIKEQINTILSNKGETKEDKATVKFTRESFAKNWKPGQPFDNKIYKQKFKNGVPYLVVR